MGHPHKCKLGVERRKRPRHMEIGQVGRRAMSGAGDQEHIGAPLKDETVEVGVYEIDAWAGAPMASQPFLDVGWPRWLIEQDVVLEIDLGHGQVVGRLTVASELPCQGCPKGCCRGQLPDTQ